MLAVLTTLAVFISTCSISVYAADPIDLTEISEPVTYTYDVTGTADSANTKVESGVKVFGNAGLATKLTATPKVISQKDITFTKTTENTAEKKVTEGQTIVVSYMIASDNWSNPAAVSFRGGLKGTDASGGSVTRYFFFEHCNGTFTKCNGKTGDFDANDGSLADAADLVNAPSKKWVKYDIVYKVGKDTNTVSIYADGRPFFEDKKLGTNPISSITQPYARLYMHAESNIYVANLKMTVYPVDYEGTIVEENPLVLNDNFIREDDGNIIYKGTRAFSNADTELVDKDGWFAQYYNGYIRIRKGTTESSVIYYYEKAADRIQNFDIANMTVNPGTKEWTVEVKNTEANPINPVVFLASYSDGEMVKCTRSEDVTIEPGKTGNLTVNLTVAEEENVDKIKIFLFGSVGELGPWKKADATTKVAATE